MAHEEDTFEGYGGTVLYRRSWHAQGDFRAVFVIGHGFGEHIGRYGHLATHLNASGITVHGFDYRGHGRSPGQRGHILSWVEYREDLRAFLKLVFSLDSGRPVFLYGHSMGSLVVLDYVIDYPDGLSGYIVSGSALVPAGVASPFRVALARLLSRVKPNFKLDLALDPASLSHETEVVNAYRNDPLVHGFASARWGTEAMEAIERIKSRIAEIHLPVLFVHGGLDKINLPEGSTWLHEHVSSPDKTLRIYPNSFHEPHNDLDRDEVYRDIVDWIGKEITVTNVK